MILASFVTTLLATVFLIVCILLIIVVLLQKGRGGGIGGAFGGMSSTAFGTRTGDVFTWVTIVLVAFFLVLAIVTTGVHRPEMKTVDTPVFLPDRPVIDKPVPVTMQVGTPKADIRYTLSTMDERGRLPDPPDPTQRSLRYDAPIRVAPNTIVKARAFLGGWKHSEIARHEYSHPDRAPQTQPAPTEAPPATSPAGAPSAKAPTGTPPATAPAATAPAKE